MCLESFMAISVWFLFVVCLDLDSLLLLQLFCLNSRSLPLSPFVTIDWMCCCIFSKAYVKLSSIEIFGCLSACKCTHTVPLVCAYIFRLTKTKPVIRIPSTREDKQAIFVLKFDSYAGSIYTLWDGIEWMDFHLKWFWIQTNTHSYTHITAQAKKTHTGETEYTTDLSNQNLKKKL